MIDPTLALIPSGYKAGKVFSVLPSDGSGDFDFTRATLATRVNKNGLIEAVANNTPRLDYPLVNGVQKGCPVLLLEPGRTNLLAYSEDFSNADWSKLGASIVSNQTVSPDGTLNADMLVEDTSNGIHIVYRNNVNTGAGANTFSVKVKANGRNWVLLYDTEQIEGIYFDLQNGVAGSTIGSPDSYSINKLPNGWYDVSLTTTSISKVDFQIYASDSDGSLIYQGDGVSGINVWGAQLEVGGYPTSYIPTSGTIVTRAVETCNSAGDAYTFNSTEGVLYVELSALEDIPTTNLYISLGDGARTSPITLRFSPVGEAIYYHGDVFLANAVSYVQPGNVDLTQKNKFALRYGATASDCSLFFNGVKQANLGGFTFSTLSALDQLNFSEDNPAGTTYNFYGNVNDLRVYNTALTNAELQTLTTQ